MMMNQLQDRLIMLMVLKRHPIDQQNFEDVEWSDQKPLEIVKEIRKVQKALRCNA